MARVVRFIWWGCFLFVAIVLQQQFPGVDFLAPGFLLALQSRRTGVIFWLFLIFVLIQEGTGTLPFGTGVLWYAGQVALFVLTQRFFVVDNFLFVSMLSFGLGAYRCVLLWLMCSFVNIHPSYSLLVSESLLQAVCFPIVWGLATFLRPRCMRHGN